MSYNQNQYPYQQPQHQSYQAPSYAPNQSQNQFTMRQGSDAGYAAPSGPPPNQYSQGAQGGDFRMQYAAYPNYPPPNLNQPPNGPPPNHQYAPEYPYRNQYQVPPAPPTARPPPTNQPIYVSDNAGHGFNYQLSNCQGNKKALLIGINYTGTSAALNGCHNDVDNFKRFLLRKGYKEDDMVVLKDLPGQQHASQPTRANMIRAMQWLVAGARANDSLFFQYSGHGGQQKDTNGDEDDGFDEVIYPLDFKSAGSIVDDDLHTILVNSLPAGCRLTAIFDSCHSGSALDLPYIYSTKGTIKEPNLAADFGQDLFSVGKTYLSGNTLGALTGLAGAIKKVVTAQDVGDRNKQTKTSPADVIMFSGSKDTQTSADASIQGSATGAMSFAFVAAMTKYNNLTYNQLLNAIRDELAGKYSQLPQMSCCHPIDTVNLLFVC